MLPINLLQLRTILQRNAPTHRLQLLLKHRALSPLSPAPVLRRNKFLYRMQILCILQQHQE